MRKKRRFIAIITIVFIVNIMVQTPALAIQSKDNVGLLCKEWINEEGKYSFPVTQYDEEWYEFETAIDMRAATQLPENILKTIPTKDLVQLILQYPLLCDLNAFSPIEEGYRHVKEQFNGIQELLLRDDAYEELMLAYENYYIPPERLVDYENMANSKSAVNLLNQMYANEETRKLIYDDASIQDAINVLEFMLLDVIENNKIKTEKFVNVYMDKVEQKNSSEYYKNNDAYALFIAVLDNDTNPFSEYMDVYSTKASSTIYIKTPSGNSVSVKYTSELTMCDYSKYAGLIAEYNASNISVASVTFNCHSFAWLKGYRSDYQHIWMNYATKFSLDPYYKKSSVAQAGDIAYWGTHSAIVQYTNMDDPSTPINAPENYCISKWADGPIVAHFMKRCPYYAENSTVEYYRPS